MWHDNPICRILGIEHPVILAPMAGASTAELAAAVTNAGAMGSFGAAATPPDALRQTVRAIRQQTSGAFNINLFTPVWEPLHVPTEREAAMGAILERYHQELDAGPVPAASGLFGPFDEQLQVLIDEKVPVVSFHFGVAPAAVAKVKAAGAVVMCSATTVAEARALEQLGVDIIIAQGSEAGGHRGTFAGDWRQALIGSLALTPQVADAVDVPVVSAGGIMDGRGLAACLALGASAVQLGTAFLACPENDIAPAYREALLQADAERPAVTEIFSGKPARGLRNRYLEEMQAHQGALLPFPAQYSIYGGIRAKATQTGNSEFLPMWAGQGVGLARPEPARDLVARVVREAEAVMTRLGR